MCTILVVLFRGFDKREAIHITDIRVSFGSQHVEAADILFETNSNLSCNILFLLSKVYWISDFFTVLISLHYTIKRGTLSGFGVGIVWPDSIHLDIKTICLQELFIDIRTISADLAALRIGKEL